MIVSSQPADGVGEALQGNPLEPRWYAFEGWSVASERGRHQRDTRAVLYSASPADGVRKRNALVRTAASKKSRTE